MTAEFTGPELLALASLAAITVVLGIRDLWGTIGPRLALDRWRRGPSARDLAIYSQVQREQARAEELTRAADEAADLADDLVLHGLDPAHYYVDQLNLQALEMRGLATQLRGRVDHYLTPHWIRERLGPGLEIDGDPAGAGTVDDATSGPDPDATADHPAIAT